MFDNNSISLKKLHNNDPEAWFEFGWHYSPELMQQAFEDLGVRLQDKKDLEALLDMHKRKADVNGQLKDAGENSIRFNALDVVKNLGMNMSRMKKKFQGTDNYHLVKLRS